MFIPTSLATIFQLPRCGPFIVGITDVSGEKHELLTSVIHRRSQIHIYKPKLAYFMKFRNIV